MSHSFRIFTKTVVALTVAAGLVLGLAANASAAPPKARKANQSVRIHQGVASGSLTRGERVALKAEQRHIGKTRARFAADGTLTPRERAKLDRMQDRASRHIYRAKHNRKHAGKAVVVVKPAPKLVVVKPARKVVVVKPARKVVVIKPAPKVVIKL